MKYCALPVRRRYLVLGAVAAVVFGIAFYFLYVRPNSASGIAVTLSRAGLPELPQSATNLTVVQKGENTRNTYVRFEAKPDEIEDFIDGTTSKKARRGPIELGSVNWTRRGRPSWWVPKECKQGRVYYLEYRRGGGVIAVDDASHTVYLNVWHTGPAWLRWLKRYLP